MFRFPPSLDLKLPPTFHPSLSLLRYRTTAAGKYKEDPMHDAIDYHHGNDDNQ
jgi:hypothetical protein